MNIYILSNREVVKNEVAGNNGENNAEIMQFHFPDKIVDIDMSNITKWIQFHNDNFDLLQMIENNKYSLTDLITQYESVEYQVLLKYNNLVLWKSNVAELDFGKSLDVDVTITLDDLSVLNQLRLQVIELKKQYEELLKQGNDDIADLIKQIEELEKKINEAETLRKKAEEGRVTAENERVEAELERNLKLNDLVKKVNDTISRLSHSVDEYNQNAETQLSRLESTADTGVSAVNSAKDSAISSISSSEETAVDNIEAKETSSIKSIDDETTKKIKEIDDNTTDKITEFDTNAENKTNTFNINSTTKTTAFNNNATSKTNLFNENATEKLNEFNNNYETKKEEINSEVSIDRISTLEQEVFEKNNIISESNYLTLDDTEEELNIAVNEIESNKLEQETREGYNKLDTTEFVSGESFGVTLVVNEDGTLLLNGTSNGDTIFRILRTEKSILATGNEDIIINQLDGSISNGTLKLVCQDTNYENLKYAQIGSSVINDQKLTNEVVYNIFSITITSGTICNNLELGLVISSEKTEYEQYGQSPSTKFPSPVEGVTGDVKLKVQNKNLAYNIKYSNATYQYGVTVIASYQLKKDRFYAISCDTEDTGQKVYINTGVGYGFRNIVGWGDKYHLVCDGKRKVWVSQALDSNIYTTNVINKSGYSEGNSPDVATGYTYNFMIEEIPNVATAEEALEYLATEYVEHKEQEVTLSLGNKTLYKGDKFIYLNSNDENANNGKGWYIYNELNKAYFKDLNLNITSLDNDSHWGAIINNTLINNVKIVNSDVSTNKTKSYSNIGLGTKSQANTVESDNSIAFLKFGTTKYIFFSKNYGETALEVKSNIEKDDNYIIYELENPTYTKITDTTLINQLNQLLRLKQYDSITNIDFNQDVIFEIDIDKSEIKLLKEINEEQNVKIEELKKENEYQEKVIDGLLNGYETETVTSDNATIYDCLNVPVDIQPRGRIYQETREGYNLAKIQASNTIDGLQRINNGDGSITIKGTATKDITYFPIITSLKISEENKGFYSVQILGLKSLPDETFINVYYIGNVTNENVYSREFVSGNTIEIIIKTKEGTNIDLTLKPFIVKGSYTAETMPPYEIYGQSPSTEFESSVEYTKGSQEIEHINENLFNYNLDFECINLINEKNGIFKSNSDITRATIFASNSSKALAPIRFKKDNYLISFDIQANKENAKIQDVYFCTDNMRNFRLNLNNTNISNKKSKIFANLNLSETNINLVNHYGLAIYLINDATITISNIQFKKGSEESEFVQHKSEKYRLDLKATNLLNLKDEIVEFNKEKIDIKGGILNFYGSNNLQGQMFSTGEGYFMRKIGTFSKGTYTFSFESNFLVNKAIALYLKDKDNQTIAALQILDSNTINDAIFNLEEEQDVFLSGYYGSSDVNLDGLELKLKINNGKQSLKWMPYVEPYEYNLYSEDDYIYYDENQKKYFVHNEYNKEYLAGKAVSKCSTGIVGKFSHALNLTNAKLSSDNIEIIDAKSNIAIATNRSQIFLYLQNGIAYGSLNNDYYKDGIIYLDEIAEATTEEANQFLEDINAYIVYPLAVPKDTEITASILIKQLDKLRKAFSYKGTNYFIVTNENGQSAKLKVIAYKDSFKILNDKINNLEQAVFPVEATTVQKIEEIPEEATENPEDEWKL